VSGLREELQRIYEDHGSLTPQIVLDKARVPTHPLHNRFDWDDATAAESWRREQAHELIRIARVVYRQADDNSEEKTVRAFHAVRNDKGYAYEPAEKVAADPFTARLVLNEMEREWQALKRRYQQFDEFLAMVRNDVEGAA
jgi:hypothetical protein